MISKYKVNIVFKISILLLIFVLISVLTLGVTYGRFLTQSNQDIGFSAKPLTPLYLDLSLISDKALYQLPQWTQTTSLISGNFTLSNTADGSDDVPADDVNFCVRVYVAASDSDGQTSTFPDDITLSTDSVTCFSRSETTKENTDFYIKNQKEGKFYRFFDSNNDKTTLIESTFCLKGNQSSTLEFTVTIFDTRVSTDQIYICIERL